MPHYSQVDLTAFALPDHLDLTAVPALTGSRDRAFVLRATQHEWRAIQRRYGDRAWVTAITLVRAGAVVLRCNVSSIDMALGAPIRWYRTAAAARAAEWLTAQQNARRDQLRTDIQDALGALHSCLQDSTNSGFATRGLTERDLGSLKAALQTELGRPKPAPKRSRILIAVIHDLCDGIIYPNARAFSQTHTGHTKSWDDARMILENSGISSAVATAIGLQRDSRIGAGGAITLHIAGRSLSLTHLRGPVLLRAEQTGLHLTLNGARLVVVENLQAAETLCDTFAMNATSDVGIVYCAGMPSQAVLDHIVGLTAAADKTVIAPDADLGGIRITTSIYKALPPRSQARIVVCDAGTTGHVQQRPWALDSPIWDELKAAQVGPAGSLAQGCLDRGYPVEQEAAIVESILRLV